MPYTLEYRDRYRRTLDTRIESDTEGSVAFASIPDNTPTRLMTEWTGKQYTKLLSALMVGADLMFPAEADEIIWQLIKVVHQPLTLEDEDEDGCINYLPSAPFVSFSPQNPYNQPDYVPPDYEAVPFKVNSDLEYPEYLGYQATDVMVNSAAFSIDPIVIATLNFPQFVLRVVGAGQIEIDLLTITAGGLLVYKVGDPPNIVDIIEEGTIGDDVVIVDLNNDSVGVPPESDIVSAQEINIDAASGVVTLVYFVFLPVLDDSLIPLRFGGGIRQIGLCGFEGEAGGVILEDIRFNTENCTFEKRILGVWEAIEGGDEWLMCVEALMATQAEIKQAIIDAAEQLAAQMLAGETENMVNSFEISKDTGEKTFIQSGLADDPETSFDEFAGSKYGAVSEIAAKLELLLDMIDSYYGTTNGAPATLEGTTQVNIKTYFPTIPALMDAAITDYYAYRATQNRLLWDRGTVFPQYLYCNGYSINALGRWLVDISGFSVTKQQIVFNLWDALADTFFSDYYAVGQEKPTNGYLDAACVPIPDQTLEAMTFGNARVTTPFKASHRMKFRITGYALDVDGDTQDAFWFRTAAGVLTRTNWTFTHSAGNNQPSDNQVPYNDAHIYEYTVDLGALNAVMTITANKNAGMNATGLTYPTPFAVEISDLGLAVSQ